MSDNWSSNRIKAALAEQGHTLASASRAAGLHRSAANIALKKHWPKAEQAIADAIGNVAPANIWPERYRETSDPSPGAEPK